MNFSKAPDSLRADEPAPPIGQELLQESPQLRPQPKLVKWFSLSSFGGRLFWLIMISTLAGLGGMALFFSVILKNQAEEQLRSRLDGKANAISSIAETAETLTYGLGVSVKTLHERGAQYPDTYRELVLQLFERRPEFVVGLGLGQSENGLIVDQPWLFPYYSVVRSLEDTSFNQDTIRYEDFADDVGEFYPQSKRYQKYFLPQINVWTEPYISDKGRILTYYFPVFSYQGRWLGTALVDIKTTYLANALDDTVFRQAGHFVLMTRSGSIITDPTRPDKELGTYRNIDGLEALWKQIDVDGRGFLRGKTGYWSYSKVPRQNWVLFGFVPYTAVYNHVWVTTAAITFSVMTVVTVVLVLSVNKLHRRLKPILLQCYQLSHQDNPLLAEWDQKDELDQLSLGFFNILEQLNLNEETNQHYKQLIAKETRHTDQVLEQFFEFTKRINQETDDQRDMIQQAQQLIVERSKEYRSVDVQLDALLAMGGFLDGDLKRVPSVMELANVYNTVEQRLASLAAAIEHDTELDKFRLQELIEQLKTDVANLKTYGSSGTPPFKKLQFQIDYINQIGQTAVANSQALIAVVQSLAESLVKVDTVSVSLNKQVQFVSDMILKNLQYRKELIANDDLVLLKPDD